MEWYDNVICIYEWDYTWEGETRTVRGYYELFSTTSSGGYVECFMGTEGAIIISESLGKGGIRREFSAPVADWEKALMKEVEQVEKAKAAAAAKVESKTEEKAGDIKLGNTIPSPGRYYPPIPDAKPHKTEHMPHLENFFEAINGKAKLNCPGEVAFETCVSILRVNDAVAAGQKVEFKPEEFKV